MGSRLDRLRVALAEQQLDAAVITSGTNRRYLTGYTAEDHAPDESSGVVAIDANGAFLFTSGTNLPWAAAEANDGVAVGGWKRPWTASIADLAAARGWRRIGFEERTTTAADYFSLRDLLGESELVTLGTTVDQLRARKDAAELDALRTAARLTDEAFTAAEAQVKPGQSEREIAAIIQQELRRLGSEGEAFATIVASGPNAAKPHHSPGDRVPQEGEPIIIDMGAVYNGYRGDLTRTIWIGQPSEQLVTIYTAVAEIQRLAIPLYRAGASGREIDAHVIEASRERGFGDAVLHGLGHGVGLRIHEAPSVGPASNDTLAEGHVVSVEPGLYIAGWGGVRIENVVAVTNDAPEDLTGAHIRTIR